jgi:hypothetical protein
MNPLARLFAQDTSLAEELALDEPHLRDELQKAFLRSQRKQQLVADAKESSIAELRSILQEEMRIVAQSEHDEREIAGDVRSLRYEHELFSHINQTLKHAASMEAYVFHLLRQWHRTLIAQARLLVQPTTDFDRLVGECELEHRIVMELASIDNLTMFYRSLAMGERYKHALELQEPEFVRETEERMLDFEVLQGAAKPLSDHNVTVLTTDCLNQLEVQAVQAVMDGILVQHPHLIDEYLNSRLFEDFVLDQIAKRGFSALGDKRMFHQFIAIFRDIYNRHMENSA